MNCLVAQSGGPTSVINSSLAGFLKAGIDNNFDKIYGLLHGIEGLIDNNIVEFDKSKLKDEELLEKLKKRPAPILGSCRYRFPNDLEDEIYIKIFDQLKKYDITNFVYIGGNDSMDTVKKLNDYMKLNDIKGINIVGCPKTIDNDLMYMDHSPGFGSAVKYIIKTIRNIRCDVDIYNTKTVTFVEIMGRNAGWLAASSLLLNYKSEKDIVNLIYLPEKSVSKEQIIEDIKKAHEKEQNIIIVVSEGFMDTEKFFLNEVTRSYDEGFNHPIISGISNKLSEYVYNQLDIKTKAVELNITQRVNDYISKTDSKEAFDLGYKALEISLDKTNLIPVLTRVNTKEYETKIEFVESNIIANKEKKIPIEDIEDKNFTKIISEYTLPLIQGSYEHDYDQGMIKYIELEDIIKERI